MPTRKPVHEIKPSYLLLFLPLKIFLLHSLFSSITLPMSMTVTTVTAYMNFLNKEPMRPIRESLFRSRRVATSPSVSVSLPLTSKISPPLSCSHSHFGSLSFSLKATSKSYHEREDQRTEENIRARGRNQRTKQQPPRKNKQESVHDEIQGIIRHEIERNKLKRNKNIQKNLELEDEMKTNFRKRENNKRADTIERGSIIEVWHLGKMSVGIYMGIPIGKKSLAVYILSMNNDNDNNNNDDKNESDTSNKKKIVMIDPGQVVNIWDFNLLDIRRELDFNTTAENLNFEEFLQEINERLAKETKSKLKTLGKKTIDLDLFWNLRLAQYGTKKNKAAASKTKMASSPTTSYDLASYLISPHAYKKAFQQLGSNDLSAKANQQYMRDLVHSKVTITWQFIASFLLANETFRFKRMNPTILSKSLRNKDSEEKTNKEMEEKKSVEPDNDNTNLYEDYILTYNWETLGYKPLDSSVVQSREVINFVTAVMSRETEGEKSSNLLNKSSTSNSFSTGSSPLASSESIKQKDDQWDATQWRILHQFELYALGGGTDNFPCSV